MKHKENPEKAFCNACCKSLSIAHQGYRDVVRHMSGQVHKSMVKELESNHKLTDSFVSDRDSMALKVVGVEVKFTGF